MKLAATLTMMLLLGGCAVSHDVPPSFHEKALYLQGFNEEAIEYSNGATYSFANVSPALNTELTDGKSFDLSIDFLLTGIDKIEVHLQTLSQKHEPFELTTFGNLSDVTAGGKLTWPVTPRGKNEIITLSLYSLGHSEAMVKSNKTLIKQVQQHHQVYCNEQEFILTLFIKKLFKYCEIKESK